MSPRGGESENKIAFLCGKSIVLDVIGRWILTYSKEGFGWYFEDRHEEEWAWIFAFSEKSDDPVSRNE
jgi:hypothetical protein